MRVRKFEAKSMKDALQMVKLELGPDAIILSVKDHQQRFGLAGDGSVEVTAAVSDVTLKKKQYTESRLPKDIKDRWGTLPAATQKQVIDKMVDARLAKQQPEPQKKKPITKVSYIDIPDETDRVNYETQYTGPLKNEPRYVEIPNTAVGDKYGRTLQNAKGAGLTSGGGGLEAVSEIETLRREVGRLQNVIQQFKQVPQSFSATSVTSNKEIEAIHQRLSQAGVSDDICREVFTDISQAYTPTQLQRSALVESFVAKWFMQNVHVCPNPDQSRLHVFVGPSGSGKSSFLIKYASHLILTKRKKVAVITSDTHKVGAVDQLKIFCQILNIPLAVVRDRSEWAPLFESFANYDNILVDTPGMSLTSLEEIDALKQKLPEVGLHPNVHLVLNCKTKDVDAFEAAKRFQVAHYQDLIFTGLDQSVQHGSIFNVQRKLNIPLHSFSVGSRIPEDFEYATKERVLDLLFKITKFPRETR